jgi:hypothetical protein
MRKHIDARIRTIVVLIGGKLTGIYFMEFTNFAMMHLRIGKKISYLPPGDVNPKLIISIRGLLETRPLKTRLA